MSKPVIFDFTKDRLWPVVAALVPEKVVDFRVGFDRRKTSPEGICGEYLLPTFVCATESGDSIERTLFVRRRKDIRPDRPCLQAHHYTFLGENGVPVPRLYAVLSDSRQREVLFLERIDEITVTKDVFYRDTDTLRQFLEIIARINAVKPTTDYAAAVGRDMAYRDGYNRNWNTWLPWSIHILNRIETLAENDLLNNSIKQFCRSHRDDINTLKDLSLKLIRVVPDLPVGIVHGDFQPGNMGRRQGTGELVVFDFEDIMFDTRFYDIAVILGDRDIIGNQPLTRRELADIYLETYSRYNGNDVDIEDFLKEIEIVWFARKLNLWEFLPPDLNGPSYESAGNTREARLDLLQYNMNTLVDRTSRIVSLLA